MSFAPTPPFSDDPERRRWQDPEAILKLIGLKAGQVFLDIGCGEGFFTIPAAVMVGETGKVYGIDISQPHIDSLKTKAAARGLKNIELQTGKAEEFVSESPYADIIFMGIVLHDFQDPARVLRNARKMIKPTGKLINLDWKQERMPLGPPLRIRFSEDRAVRLISGAGFRVETVAAAGSYHYLITARPEA